MGFICFFVVCVLNSVAADNESKEEKERTHGGKSMIYGLYIGMPSIIFMIINIAFLGSCRNYGKTIIFEYGITICIFYGLIIMFQAFITQKMQKLMRKEAAQGRFMYHSAGCLNFLLNAKPDPISSWEKPKPNSKSPTSKCETKHCCCLDRSFQYPIFNISVDRTKHT